MTEPLRVANNLFHGINPHLHSHLQAHGGWDEFHTHHLADLHRALRSLLLPMGYTAALEPALQIRRFGEPIGKAEADVSIFDTNPARSYRPTPPQPTSPNELVLLFTEMVSLPAFDQHEYRAIAVYTLDDDERGQPVAWLELLSPSNKPGGRHAAYYADRRIRLLESGVVYIELDYLHETPPTFSGLPNQHANPPEAEAYAYRIVVIDPRPSLYDSMGRTVQFDVDDAIPTVTIPLNDGDVLRFDFDAPYQKTYRETLYGLEIVDYRRLPTHFDRYSPSNQQRIAVRMIAILEAAMRGETLEADRLKLPDLSLTDALTRLQALV